ncbi:VOC family protein [Nonomuraea sp. NPDC049784]|uniref:VOC family protein n=1 Tax=Nonomuraea sp. NPDC049784 TaxID=3154361 RepID=UPI0033DEDDA9
MDEERSGRPPSITLEQVEQVEVAVLARWSSREAAQHARDRIRAFGASEVRCFDAWVVLADPEGNQFCVVAA